MTIEFTKMHALGNDFMMIDTLANPDYAPGGDLALSAQNIRLLADRHRGVGFDQLLMIDPPPHADVDFGYRIFNADGCEVEQCGNGARCVAHYLKNVNHVESSVVRVATKNRILQMHLSLPDGGGVAVELGIPRMSTSTTWATGFDLTGACQSFVLVDMGNPHAVFWVKDIEQIDVDAQGAAMQQQPSFISTQGVNVGFVQILDRRSIRLRVYERGVGESLSCGSGACAAVVAARSQGFVEDTVAVECRGGQLKVHWPGPGEQVLLSGPTTLVFTGCWKNLSFLET